MVVLMKYRINSVGTFWLCGNIPILFLTALMQTINDLFGAGSDTINFMLKWVSHLLAKNPEIAKKIHQEIDNVVPADRLVSVNDKPE